MKKVYIYILKLIAVVLFFGMTSCKSVREGRTMKMANGLDENHPVHKAMVLLAKNWKKSREVP